MADIGWRRRRGSSPAARTGARQRAGLTPASASNTLSCQRETLHSQQLRSIKKSIDSDHGIYRDLRNVDANYPFERSHRFAGIQPNSGFGDYSRLSCGVGDTQLGRRPGSRQGCLRGRHQPSSRGFPGSEPNSGQGDHSRLSCSAGDKQLGAGFCGDLQQRSAPTLAIMRRRREGTNWPRSLSIRR